MIELKERILDLEYRIRGEYLDISVIRDQLLELIDIVADLIHASLPN